MPHVVRVSSGGRAEVLVVSTFARPVKFGGADDEIKTPALLLCFPATTEICHPH